ncbi:uncharacterized protein TNCV_1721841 [Trichonephila clavipes]|nr:uncharacterized protein TNCV_1721841 [Trichonephila clavipes]
MSLYGRDSLVVKVTDSWSDCHEFEPSTAEDPPCRGAMHVKPVESSNVLPLEGVPAQVSSLSTMVQNYEVRRQKPSTS